MPPEGLDKLRNARILVVEDSVANQTLARDLLSHAGAHVVLAGNGREAIDAVRDAKIPFDVVLMDLQMPVMDGLQATAILRGELAQVMPIIATSAHSNKEEQERCIAAGANDCLPKPFHISDLYAVLGRWLAVSQLEGGNASAGQDGSDIWLPDSLDGIDLAGGLDSLGQNRALYAELLAEFAKTNATLAEELTRAAQQDDRDRIRFLVHAIRSTAGSIGARDLSAAAAAAEDAVIGGDGGLDSVLARFQMELARVLTALVGAGSGPAVRQAAAPVEYDKDRAEEIYERLLLLLDDQDMSARDEFGELAAMLGGGGQDGVLDDIAGSMDALDYSNARQILVRVGRTLLR